MSPHTVSVDYRPSGRGGRSETLPVAVTAFDGEASVTTRWPDREGAMEHAARLAGVKL